MVLVMNETKKPPPAATCTTPASPASGKYWLQSALILFIALGSGCTEEGPAKRVAGGDAESGQLLIDFYQCGSCHRIPGVEGARGVVGPPLTQFGLRSFIAGAVPNQPESLVDWLMDPQSIEPGTAMPDVGLTQPEARDIAAFLYTLR